MDDDHNRGTDNTSLARSAADQAADVSGHAQNQRLRSLYLTRAPGRAGQRARRLIAQAQRRHR